MASGRVEYYMVSVSNSGHLIIHMMDISTWTNAMPLESLHIQVVMSMRANRVIINAMDMEFIHGQMEMFTMVNLKITKDME